MINCCYAGNGINSENVFTVLKLALRWEFTLIEKQCYRYLINQLSVRNYVEVWNFADLLTNCKEIVQVTENYVLEHFVEVSKTDGLLQLNADRLFALLSRNDLFVWSEEEEVFLALVKWFLNNRKARDSQELRFLSITQFIQLFPDVSFLNVIFNVVSINRVFLLCYATELKDFATRSTTVTSSRMSLYIAWINWLQLELMQLDRIAWRFIVRL